MFRLRSISSSFFHLHPRSCSGLIPSPSFQHLRIQSRSHSSTSSDSTSLLAILHTLSPADLQRLHDRTATLSASLSARHATLVASGASSALTADRVAELRSLEPLARLRAVAVAIEDEIADVRALADGAPPDMLALVDEETATLGERLRFAAAELLEGLIEHAAPVDGDGDGGGRQKAILEIRAGAGGDEAALFVSDLMTMYEKYATRRAWRWQVLAISTTQIGGVREAIVRFEGEGVYSRLRLEAGGHRVQRVPETESAGRVHTSAASVAVLRGDTAAAKTTVLKDVDVRMDVYRASGAGGQHVNKTESAVRLTHIPTGLIAQSQEDRSQHRNRLLAMEALVARVVAREAKAEAEEKAKERHAQLGSNMGERGDRIRTYNFPQRRVTDHRIVVEEEVLDVVPNAGSGGAEKNAPLDAVLEGGEELDRLMDAVARQADLQRIVALVRAADIVAGGAVLEENQSKEGGGKGKKSKRRRESGA